MEKIVKRRISCYDCTIDFESNSVSIIGDYISNYGVIYPFNAGKYRVVYAENNMDVIRHKQLFGTETPVANKKITKFFNYHIDRYYTK